MKIESERWLTVAEAAKLLRTTPAKIRERMGDGTLEWTQERIGGKLKVSMQSALAFRSSDANPNKGKPPRGLRPKDPLAVPQPRIAALDQSQAEAILAPRKRNTAL